MQRTLKPPLYQFLDVLRLHEQIETKIRKWGDQNLEKNEGGRVFGPVFLKRKKVKEYDTINRLKIVYR